ncbi:MAG: hypothetical protein ACYDDZ_11045 [Acidimicrobiales bacterium]
MNSEKSVSLVRDMALRYLIFEYALQLLASRQQWDLEHGADETELWLALDHGPA